MSRPRTAPVSSGRSRVMTGRTNSKDAGFEDSFTSSSRLGLSGRTTPIRSRPVSTRAPATGAFGASGGGFEEPGRPSSSGQLQIGMSGFAPNIPSSRRPTPRPETLTPSGVSGRSAPSKGSEAESFQQGYQKGLREGKASAASAASEASRALAMTPSARAMALTRKRHEEKTKAQLEKDEASLEKFVARNSEEMWEYIPALYHTQRDQHHHTQADDWLLTKTKDFCASSFRGDTSAMMRAFEAKEIGMRLNGSKNMLKTLQPTARVDVPNSVKAVDPVLFGMSYDTARKSHAETLKRLYSMPPPAFLGATNTKTEHNKERMSLHPFSLPGEGGRTNLNGWADANSAEGVGNRPPFLRGSPFASAHVQF